MRLRQQPSYQRDKDQDCTKNDENPENPLHEAPRKKLRASSSYNGSRPRFFFFRLLCSSICSLLALVQMVQNAGLVRAQDSLRLGITDVPRVTGKVDAGVKLHHLYGGIPRHLWESYR